MKAITERIRAKNSLGTRTLAGFVKKTITGMIHCLEPSILSSKGTGEITAIMEGDLKKVANKVMEKARELCKSKSVEDFEEELAEGDARVVLCEAVEKHNASILVVGSHGYNAIKRALLGSVSDYCAHNAQYSVMIVKKPKNKS